VSVVIMKIDMTSDTREAFPNFHAVIHWQLGAWPVAD
jgi:hypothetical protein